MLKYAIIYVSYPYEAMTQCYLKLKKCSYMRKNYKNI